MFKLFACTRGNGITFHNRGDMSTGDYREIAWVSPAGNIHYRIAETMLPEDAIRTIRNAAACQKIMFRRTFEKLPEDRQYMKILDALPTQMMFHYMDDCRPLCKKLPEMRAHYYKLA